MKENKNLNEETFFEFYDSKDEDNIIAEIDDYTLVKVDLGNKKFLYKVFDPDMQEVTSWRSLVDIEKAKNIYKTTEYTRFNREVLLDQETKEEDEANDVEYDDLTDTEYGGWSWDDDDDDDYYGFNKQLAKDEKRSQDYNSKFSNSNIWGKSSYYSDWKEPDPIDIEPYCKSDTLVMHLDDPSTVMLGQVYDGKGWDVIRSKHGISDKDLAAIVDRHDRLVFLGHGTSGGLIGFFGGEMAKHIEDKKVFAIWCNADGYFNRYGIGKGQFVTGNMPSEVWECSYAGCGHISKQLMLDNITYWSKLCADVTEDCLEGKVKESVDYVRKNYLEKYGNHPVSIYNAKRTQCLGEEQPLPEYEFKGEPLKDDEKPYSSFNEEEFLKNPTENGRDPNPPKYDYSNYYSNYGGSSYWGNNNDGIVSNVHRTSSNSYYSSYDLDHDSKNKINVKTISDDLDKMIDDEFSDYARNLLKQIMNKRNPDTTKNFINLYDADTNKAYYISCSFSDATRITKIEEVDEEKYPVWFASVKQNSEKLTNASNTNKDNQKSKTNNINAYGDEVKDQIRQMADMSKKYHRPNQGWAYDPDKDIVLKAYFDAQGNLTEMEEEKNISMINRVKQAYDDALHGRDPYAGFNTSKSSNASGSSKNNKISGPGNTQWEEPDLYDYLDELEQQEKQNKDNPPKK